MIIRSLHLPTKLFRYELESGRIDKIRKAANGNFSSENDNFKEEISETPRRRVTPDKARKSRKENVEKLSL